MSTPTVKVVSVLPGWWRVVALFGAGVGLLGVVEGLALIVPNPPQVGPIPAQPVVILVLIAGVLIPLSFGERRLRRSCFEAVAVGKAVVTSSLPLLPIVRIIEWPSRIRR